MGSLSSEERAVSEVLAVVVLMLIATTLGVALYAYSEGVFGTARNSLQSRLEVQRKKLLERFTITAVWARTSPANLMNVTVLNYGKIQLAIDAVYVDGQQVMDFSEGEGYPIRIGSLVSVKFTSPVSISEGNSYQMVLVSERGSSYAVRWKA